MVLWHVIVTAKRACRYRSLGSSRSLASFVSRSSVHWIVLRHAQVLTQAGAYVKEEVVRALIVLITNAPDLHGYCARAMYRALRRDLAVADPALITAGTWVIGAGRDLP